MHPLAVGSIGGLLAYIANELSKPNHVTTPLLTAIVFCYVIASIVKNGNDLQA